jgi:hypothetical protein
MRWHMVLFGGDVMLSGGMLPDEEVGYEELFGFGNSCIELNPLPERQNEKFKTLYWT